MATDFAAQFASEGPFFFSGGAKGADMEWADVARGMGYPIVHCRSGRATVYSPAQERLVLGPTHLAMGTPYLVEANATVKRTVPIPSRNDYVLALLQRNYWSIRYADSVYAVGYLDAQRKVAGGTAWACAMFLDQWSRTQVLDGIATVDAPLFFYDQAAHEWLVATVNGTERERGWRTIASPPKPGPKAKWCGIGSRDLSAAGTAAIRTAFV